MMENTKKKKKEEPVLDFGLSFGGLLKELGDFTRDLTDMVEEGRDEMVKTGEISFDQAKKLRGIYGISVRIGGNGSQKSILSAGVPDPKRGSLSSTFLTRRTISR